MKATDFLDTASALLSERGKQYDQPKGERSMGKTVAAFQNITGKRITEAEGWLFMEILKNVRQWQNPEKYHADSAHDGVAYSALKAEALFSQTLRQPYDEADAAYDQIRKHGAQSLEMDEARADIIGQNGNDGIHYDFSDMHLQG